MLTALTGFKIWILTVFLNALSFGVITLYTEGLLSASLGVLVFIAGLLLGLPFLVLTVALIRLTSYFPYGAAAKMTWVFVIESLMAAFFYACTEIFSNGQIGFNNPQTKLLTGTTIAAFLVALYFNRGAFARASAGSAPSGTPDAVSSTANNTAP